MAPPSTTRTVTIPAGQSMSNAIDASNATQVFLGVPNAWSKRAPLTFQYSPDGGVTYFDAIDPSGKDISFPVVPGTMMRIDTKLANKGWLKFRSGTRRYPVPQEAERTFTVSIVAAAAATLLPASGDEP